MTHHFRRGLDIIIDGTPQQSLLPGNAAQSVAILGRDHPGLRPEFLVAEGDRVARGDPLVRDRKRPQILLTSPASGTVEAIEIGPRRRLSQLRIRCGGSSVHTFARPATPTRETVADLAQQAGLWPCFIERPFGRTPDPGSAPDAIFVTAMETDPLAPNAGVVVAARVDLFRAGLNAATLLTDGPVHVCQAPGAELAEGNGQIRVEQFAGRHPAGLPGTHIDRIHPVGQGRRIWQIHYQDVIALGSVMTTGTLPATRVVALAGPGVLNPRLIEAPEGAALNDLVYGELHEGQMQVVSGSPLSGRESGYLLRRDHQVTVLRRRQPQKARRRWWAQQAAAPRPAPLVPTQALGRALGPDLPVVPLMRALSVGDVETADRLGCRALLEEDMALATYATGGTQDFGALLRRVLDELERLE